MKSSITGLVFAGGQSRRMGTDKTILEWKGEPLWKIAADKLNQVCDEVLILSGNHSFSTTYPCIPDSPDAQGPLAGLIAGLENARNASVLALGCDMPLVPKSFLEAMINQFGPESEVFIPEQNGQSQFLCSLWRKSALPVLQEAAGLGQFALKNIIYKLSAQFAPADLIFDALPTGAFLNINTPSDWEILQKMASNEH